MLELNNIKKVYEVGDLKVDALKGVSLKFRRSEFVSILGPSGCGKTTMLNIIGGLDRYTDGDLVINGTSTKQFKDKDWDKYRNHSVGFVFQSYNLIEHQTVLENVELALTLSGVSREERRKRATAVLEKVGLGDKLKNKPNQLSGGQMQRVAIARALVNDPEIILADEPTGALDTATSVQIMELLKEISKDKLIIMVTHNPDLAEEYSTRIVKLLDGELTSDSDPFDGESEDARQKALIKEQNKGKKRSMSFFTALFLSFKNLLTKKGRTILVAFAGSIGIIGIALILAISSGFSNYVNKIQEDTLSTYPITISAKNIDFSSLIFSMMSGENETEETPHDKDGVYNKDSISSILNNVGSSLNPNNLTKFYEYIGAHRAELDQYVNAIQYTYDLDLEFCLENGTNVQPNSPAISTMIKKYSLYYFANNTNTQITENVDGSCLIETTENTDYSFFVNYPELGFIQTALQGTGECLLNGLQVFQLVSEILDINMSTLMGAGTSNGFSFGNMDIVNEMIDNDELIKSQYDLVGENSHWIEAPNQALLVLDKNNEIDEYILYALGLVSDSDMSNLLDQMVKGNKLKLKIDYDDIIGKRYKVLEESDFYIDEGGELINFDTKYNNQVDPVAYAQYKTLYSSAVTASTNELEIVGIVRLNDKTDNGSLSVGIAYGSEFTEQMLNYHNESEARAQNKVDALSQGTPKTISIYVNSFESKDKVKAFVDKYNAQAENGDEISYSDMVGIIMSTVSTIINAITYVLIAFVSVSLIVSSIMIGIITYISVIERTKEIGVLRSVGASKRDVKRVFTAESFIIGLFSGALGIAISVLLTIPVNILLKKFTDIAGLASLPVLGAIILVAISIGLTLIAGLIPANVAAKKDPVDALRSE